MDLLPVLFPQVRAEVLRLLFADASAELHLRELTRRSGLALGTLQTELAKLSAAQLVVSERDGNRRYYRANAAHPIFPVLRQLVLQATGAAAATEIPTLECNATPSEGSRSDAAVPADGASAAVGTPSARWPSADQPSAPTDSAHFLTLNEID